jgi:hypothetical protein
MVRDPSCINHCCGDAAYLSMPLRPDAAELSDKQTLVNTAERR